MRILVTGSAGFMGFTWLVVGLDGFTPYYDRSLKLHRHGYCCKGPGSWAMRRSWRISPPANDLWRRFDAVYHFAAQAGVRESLDNPRAYLDANLTGTFNLLELIRHAPPAHAPPASTSSVYGACEGPISRNRPGRPSLDALCRLEKGACLQPSLQNSSYNAQIVHDLRPLEPPGHGAFFKFATALFEGRPIAIYNHGKMSRDFTYIDDLIEAMLRLLSHAPPLPEVHAPPLAEVSLSSVAPWRVVKIGAETPVTLMDFVAAIGAATGVRARCNFMAIQQGDVPVTFADTLLLLQLTGFMPKTSLKEGVKRFIAWYRNYFGV